MDSERFLCLAQFAYLLYTTAWKGLYFPLCKTVKDVSQRASRAGKSELSGADNIWMELPWRCNRRPTTRRWGFNECLPSEAERVKTTWLVLETKGWGAGMLEELTEEEEEWCKATPEVAWGLWAQRSCLETFFLCVLFAVTQETIGRTMRRGSLRVLNCGW